MTLTPDETLAAEAFKHNAKMAYEGMNTTLTRRYTRAEFAKLDVPELGHNIVEVMRYASREFLVVDTRLNRINAWLDSAKGFSDTPSDDQELLNFSEDFQTLLGAMYRYNVGNKPDGAKVGSTTGYFVSIRFPALKHHAQMNISMNKQTSELKLSLSFDSAPEDAVPMLSLSPARTFDKAVQELKS